MQDTYEILREFVDQLVADYGEDISVVTLSGLESRDEVAEEYLSALSFEIPRGRGRGSFLKGPTEARFVIGGILQASEIAELISVAKTMKYTASAEGIGNRADAVIAEAQSLI